MEQFAVDLLYLYHNNLLRISTTADGADISGTGSLKIPVGTTAQRSGSPTAGDLRYNSTTNSFEGYNGTNWIVLNGVQDLDGDTNITAELTPGANDNTIIFLISYYFHFKFFPSFQTFFN